VTNREGGPVDFLAWAPHFLDHLLPVFQALPDERRGTFYVSPALLPYAKARGVDAKRFTATGGDNITVVSAYGDLGRALRMGQSRRLVLMEHGAGFTFLQPNSSYAGWGELRSRISLFLSTNEQVYRANKAKYPNTPNVICGCPKLDKWDKAREHPRTRTNPPTVAISFHWDCQVVQEARSAFPFYRGALREMAKKYRLIGHAHPRIWGRIARTYREFGIEAVRSFDEVMERADLYVNDCSSTLYEFAYLDRPVVVLNCPWYRKNVHHGLRFWKHSDVGVNCERIGDLLPSVAQALADPPEQQEKRRRAVDYVYPVRGNAAEVAAEAICQLGRSAIQGRITSSAPATSALSSVFGEAFRTNKWRSSESKSGRGSELKNTGDIRHELPRFLRNRGVGSLLDAGCGDWNWIRELKLGVEYTGVDIVPELISGLLAQYAGPGRRFLVADITKDELPPADVVLCRSVLYHFSFDNIWRALSAFRRCARMGVLLTYNPDIRTNRDIPDGKWRRLDLRKAPFNLPEPSWSIPDLDNEPGALGFWKTEELPEWPSTA